MSSNEKKANSIIENNVNNTKTKIKNKKKSKIQKELDKLRKSKAFRELGDMLYLD